MTKLIIESEEAGFELLPNNLELDGRDARATFKNGDRFYTLGISDQEHYSVVYVFQVDGVERSSNVVEKLPANEQEKLAKKFIAIINQLHPEELDFEPEDVELSQKRGLIATAY